MGAILKKYFRVETETGILRTATENFPREFLDNSPHICTMFGPITSEEFGKIYKALWTKGSALDQPHLFTPSQSNNRFCGFCGLYFTNEIHQR